MVDDLKRIIGAKVKAARIENGITQEKLAEMIDRTVETVSNIERGRTLPSLSTLQALATSMSMSLKELVEEDAKLTVKTDKRIALELKIREIVGRLNDDELQIASKQIQALLRN